MKDAKTNREFEKREQEFPDNMTNSIHAVVGGLTEAHHLNQAQNAQLAIELAKVKNVIYKLQAGELDADQALTLMMDIPFQEFVTDEDFGLQDGCKYEMEMDINIHRKNVAQLGAGSQSKVSGHYGGGILGALSGARGKVEATAYIKTSLQHADEERYHAASKLTLMMGLRPAPKGRKLIRDVSTQLLSLAIELVKDRAKQQQQLLHDELAEKELPQTLPEDDFDEDFDSDFGEEKKEKDDTELNFGGNAQEESDGN